MQHDKSDKSPLSDKDSISTAGLGPSGVLPVSDKDSIKDSISKKSLGPSDVLPGFDKKKKDKV